MLTRTDAGRNAGARWPRALRAVVAALAPGLLAALPAQALTLSLPSDAGAPPGSSAVVPLSVDEASGMLGTDILITYDPSVALATEVSVTELSAGQSLTANLSPPGTIRISLFGPVPLAGSGALLTLSFVSSEIANSQTALDLVTASVNEGAIPALLEDGRYCVQGVPGEVRDLRIHPDGSGSTVGVLDWLPDPYATSYGVYRAGEPDLRDLGCFLSGVPGPPARDETSPDPGRTFYYLVTAVNCRGQSTAGFDASGNERKIPVPCP